MATEDKLWLPPLSPKDQKRLDLLRNNRMKAITKRTGFFNKTLWDWLQLLIIPIVLVIVGSLFNLQQSQTNNQIALDQQRETILETYLDRMSDLLLVNKLYESKPGDEALQLARTRTLVALERLDPIRKGVLLKFLYGSGLIGTVIEDRLGPIGRGESKISLAGADLTDANLSYANLGGIDLRFANLSNADLSYTGTTKVGSLTLHVIGKGGDFGLAYANLNGADLSNADLHDALLLNADLRIAVLSNADLSNADLDGADLSYAYLKGATVTQEQLAKVKSLQGAIMPDGSTHP